VAWLLLLPLFYISAAGWILVAGAEARDDQCLFQCRIIQVRECVGHALRFGAISGLLICCR
jgi:hypothetical protein